MRLGVLLLTCSLAIASLATPGCALSTGEGDGFGRLAERPVGRDRGVDGRVARFVEVVAGQLGDGVVVEDVGVEDRGAEDDTFGVEVVRDGVRGGGRVPASGSGRPRIAVGAVTAAVACHNHLVSAAGCRL